MITYHENDLSPAEVDRIRAAVGWSALPEGQLAKALAACAYSVAAHQQGQPVGMARLVGDGVYYLLCDVAVLPACQGQGVGRELVRRAVDFARRGLREGQRCSITLVSAKGKEPFYRSLGFASIPGDRAGDGMQLLLTR